MLDIDGIFEHPALPREHLPRAVHARALEAAGQRLRGHRAHAVRRPCATPLRHSRPRPSLAALRARGVRYVILHRGGYGPNKWARIERDLPALRGRAARGGALRRRHRVRARAGARRLEAAMTPAAPCGWSLAAALRPRAPGDCAGGCPANTAGRRTRCCPQDVDAAVGAAVRARMALQVPAAALRAARGGRRARARSPAALLGWDAAGVHDARMTAGRVLSLAMSLGVLDRRLPLRPRARRSRWPACWRRRSSSPSACPSSITRRRRTSTCRTSSGSRSSLLFFLRALRRGADARLRALRAGRRRRRGHQGPGLRALRADRARPGLGRSSRACGRADRRAGRRWLGARVAVAFARALAGSLFNPADGSPTCGSSPARPAPRSACSTTACGGHAELLWQTARHLAFVMGWPSLLAALAGLVLALRDRGTHRALLATLVPVVSYVVFFLAVVLYVYDRFLLPVALVLSLFGGLALARALRARLLARCARGRWPCSPSGRRARPRWTSCSQRDSRYAVEDWLRREVGPAPLVAAVGPLEYLPRLDGLRWRRLGPAASRLRPGRSRRRGGQRRLRAPRRRGIGRARVLRRPRRRLARIPGRAAASATRRGPRAPGHGRAARATGPAASGRTWTRWIRRSWSTGGACRR